ncbi:MAG: biotin--[acetyl-CoA-carboxylase] ligase [Candidatus Krumholzibacteria bacterium]|nr:biotin--[acetyl-CoA-carboxylase] ligase [Candidatus Krumholzibacteria bacterium]
MLFVDNPEEFRRILPGFLPRTLRPAESGPRDAFFGSECPTLLTADHPENETGDFWTSFHLFRRASVSQYDALRQLIATRKDLPGHVLYLALSGTDFHGQQGRAWVAETGNLHITVGLRCDLAAADCGLALTMLPAVAVVDALSTLDQRPSGLGIKWVNDILVDGRKIGGVLTSARSQDGRIRSAVLGIGLNVMVSPTVPSTPFTPGITCLKDSIPLPPNGLTMVLRLVLSALEKRFEELVEDGPGPLLRAYRAVSLVLGRDVEIRPEGHSSDPPRRGRVLAIGPDLALTLTDDPAPVTTGRLILLPK